MFSRFFIERPVFASVLSIIIVLSGLMAIRGLPIAQYPDIIPPDVVVTTSYPGASAEVIAGTVAAPLEQQINGVPDMLYMRSTSTDSGQLTLTVTFEIGTDPDQATIDVNNRVQAALARLPEDVRRQGVTVAKRSSSILEVITMYSPTGQYDPIYVSNYTLLNVLDELKRVPGVGDATIFGAKDYSMRLWIRPDKMAQYNLVTDDIAAAVREQNSQFAAGQLGQQPVGESQSFTYTVKTLGRFIEPSQFEEIVLRANPDGSSLKLKDVARVELGSQDYSFAASYNGKPSVAIGIYLQPGANAIAVTAAVNKRMEELSARFPEGISYALPFDTTKFVEVSIHEVIMTLAEAVLLVVFVVYLFLQNARATLIPLLAVPVSLIGTFAGMYLLGFSINLLTLFGMVLAIGIVVDDAIVVLENVERIMTTEKLSPKEASIKAMGEVTGPVVAIVLVLCAVFVPVGFMGGLTGQMYKQFAITIAVSVIISGIVALTLTPALCALILKPTHNEPYKILQKFNTWFHKLTEGYTKIVSFFLKRAGLGLCLFAALVSTTYFLFRQLPNSLVPEEDQGYVMVVPILLPGASLDRTLAVTKTVTERALQQPETRSIVMFAGFDLFTFANKSSAGASFISLKDWDERKALQSDARALTGRLMGINADIKDAFVLAINPPPITGMSITGGFEGYIQNKSGADIAEIAQVAGAVVEAAKKRPELRNVQTTVSPYVPQYYATLDRAKAKALNIPISDVFSVMQSTFGTYYINDFSLYGRSFRVMLQAEGAFRDKPEDLRYVYVRTSEQKMVPLSSLVTMKRVVGPDLVERFNIFPSAKVMGEPAPGYSSGQAIAAMEEIANQILSKDYSLSWMGSAYQEKAASGSSAFAFIFGILMVFLILAAQYERWSLPLAVITAVPFAVFGAVVAVWLRGLSNDVYFQVGLITLIGLGAKNAILIVEFAVLKHNEGLSLFESAIAAAKLRFRPIVMTSLAFILGCVPLATSSGAGAASRHSIGTGVIGGMLAATCIAILFVPMFYKLISQLAPDSSHSKNKKDHPHE